MTTAVIRAITHGDIDSFWQALDRVAREKKYLARDEAPPIDSTRAFVGKNIAAGHPHIVALIDNVVVGWCDIMPRNPEEPAIGVLGMGVVDDQRGKGIGEALIRAALIAAQDKGFDTIRLDVRTDNERAVKLYEKVGFRILRTYDRDNPHRMVHDMVWHGF